jgi:neutral ceramidase
LCAHVYAVQQAKANLQPAHDRVYARAIVLDNGITRAVLLGADLGMFTEDSYHELAERIMQKVGCPIEQILMSGTHTRTSRCATAPYLH